MLFAANIMIIHRVLLPEFLDDMNGFKYVKRLFRKYSATGELRTRLIINHIVF